jgi:hypothetical protein
MSSQTSIGCSWWLRGIILEKWKGVEECIERGFRDRIVSWRVSQVLFEGVFATEQEFAVAAVVTLKDSERYFSFYLKPPAITMLANHYYCTLWILALLLFFASQLRTRIISLNRSFYFSASSASLFKGTLHHLQLTHATLIGACPGSENRRQPVLTSGTAASCLLYCCICLLFPGAYAR